MRRFLKFIIGCLLVVVSMWTITVIPTKFMAMSVVAFITGVVGALLVLELILDEVCR